MGDLVHLDGRRADRADPAAPEFMFDLAEPDGYLAAERVEELLPAAEWVPVRADMVRELRGEGEEAADDGGDRRARARAAALGLPLVLPERHPAPRPAAMRAAAYAAEAGRGREFTLAAARLAFCGGYDLDDPEILAEAAGAAGLELHECLREALSDERDEPMRRTARVLAERGVERLPAVRVGRRVFAGEERLAEAAAAATGALAAAGPR